MTTNLTVAIASGKMRVAFCKLFFSETNSEKWKKKVLRLTTCGVLRRNKHAQCLIQYTQTWSQAGYHHVGGE